MSHAEKLKTKNQKLKTKNSFEFLFVGRIVRDKGINELVEAFCRLNSEKPETRLVLVGFYEQNLDPVSEETHRRIEENPNIIMAGERTGDDLVRSYAEADCFVFPSYREGFPNTVLEAGAMGLPCIVTDINGSREIITDIAHADLADHADNLYFDHGSTRIHTDFLKTKNYTLKTVPPTDDTDSHGKLKTKTNGIIIPPRDAEALYEAMKMMVTDDRMREAMARNARPMIESRFEQGFVRRCLYDFYEEILNS
jgi:glycosyltransferase involved in cell wall biosynthesis